MCNNNTGQLSILRFRITRGRLGDVNKISENVSTSSYLDICKTIGHAAKYQSYRNLSSKVGYGLGKSPKGGMGLGTNAGTICALAPRGLHNT